MTLIVILNVVLAILIVGAIVALHGWGIAADRSDRRRLGDLLAGPAQPTASIHQLRQITAAEDPAEEIPARRRAAAGR